MVDEWETVRLCVEFGHLPEAGGIEDQDPDLLEAMEIVEAERLGAMTEARRRR